MADSSAEVVNACLNLMRRLSPKDIKDNLSGLISLAPAYMDDLLQRVDQPLEEDKDPTNGRNFLLCEYNRDEESYRSPWSNQYFPPLEDAYLPGSDLRKLEVDANELLDAYRDMYYEGGVSSVYLWDTEEGNGGFAGAFLISKKVGNDCGWQSIHVVEVSIEPGGKRAAYKLNTTVMLSVRPAEHSLLSGSTSNAREKSITFSTADDHLVNIGQMIEAMEIDIRRDMDGLHVQKTRQVLSSIRVSPGSGPSQGNAFTNQLVGAIGAHGVKRETGLADKVAAMALSRK